MEAGNKGVFSETVVYCTAMYLAAQNGHRNVVKYISDLKIKPDKEEAFQATALYLATYNGCSDMHQLFTTDTKQSVYSDGLNLYERSLERLEQKMKIGKTDKVINMLLKSGINSVDENGNTALHLAARDGNINLLERLLKLKASVEIKNKNYESLLHLAAGSGNVEVVRLLLEFIFVDARNLFNNTPLYYAIKKGDVNVIELLLEQRACINIVNKNNDAPLHYVDNEDVLNLMIGKGGDIALTKPNGNSLLHNAAEKNFEVMIDVYIQRGIKIDSLNHANETALHLAAKLGYKNIVRKLLQHNADMNCRTSSGAYAIHLASSNGHPRVVDTFLERGIDVNLTMSDNKSCLLLAVENGHADVVKTLLSKGANNNMLDKNHVSPIECAIKIGNIEIAELFLNSIDVNKLWYNDRTILSLATEKRNVDLVKMLLKKGADVNIIDKLHMSPINYAINKGSIDIVELFLNNINVNKLWYNNRTVLSFAAEVVDVNLVKFLLNKGADVNVVDNRYMSPIHYAINKGSIEIVELCLNSIDVDTLWSNNRTVLSLAAEKANVNLVKVLLSKNADVDIVDSRNMSPIHYAINKKNLEIVELCLNKVNINKIWNDNRTFLSLAIEKSDVDLVKLLLKYGADVNIIDNCNNLPIHLALRKRLTEIAEICLNTTNNINHVDNYKNTPLSLAIGNNNIILVKKIFEKQPDVSLTNINSTISYLLENKCLEIINTFLDKLSNINETFINGRTLLSFAAEYGHTEMIKQLLSKGADVNITDTDNFNSPIHYAFQNKHFDIVELCLKGKYDVHLLNNNHDTYISLASENNHEPLVRKLLAKAPNKTYTSYYTSPLYKASCKGHLIIVKILLKHEKDNRITSYNKSEISYTLQEIKHPNIKLLLQEYIK